MKNFTREAVVTNRFELGRVPIDRFTFNSAVQAVANLRHGTVFTPNVDHVVEAQVNPAFAEAYSRCALSLADGWPLVALSRLTDAPLPCKASGSDLLLPVMEELGRRGKRVLLVGPGAYEAREAQARLPRDCPGLDVPWRWCPRYPGTPTEADAKKVCRLADSMRVDVVLFSLGAPKQELLADMVAQRSRVACLCFGGALDFYVGKAKRAPGWVSGCGLEWAHRLLQDPKRFAGRYARDILRFPWIALRSLVREAS